jgi:MoxR-like ATPase
VEAAHARLCERRAWVLNEKRIIERAGLERVQPLFRKVPGNDALLGWVADIEAALRDTASPTASGVRG